MMLIDLDELPRLDTTLRTFGHARPRLYSFRDTDHLQFPAGKPSRIPLRDSLTAWLASEGVEIPANARIQLLTLPRVLGHIFNPVSFYFVHDAAGKPITAVAEVQNTFGELKPYRVPLDSIVTATTAETTTNPGREQYRRRVRKEFYVSPFSSLDLNFDFRLRTPGERLNLGVNDIDDTGATHLISTLTGDRLPLTDTSLLRMTARHPLMTMRVITLIHWHALRLWFKRLPWFRKADRRDLQTGVFRPHSSLTPAPIPPPST